MQDIVSIAISELPGRTLSRWIDLLSLGYFDRLLEDMETEIGSMNWNVFQRPDIWRLCIAWQPEENQERLFSFLLNQFALNHLSLGQSTRAKDT